jgi:hypothetical protein
MTRGPELYENVKRQEENWLRSTVQKRITDSISSTLIRAQAATEIQDQSEERRAAGEKFLSAFKEAWEDHQLCMSMITDVLMYMVRAIFAVPSTFSQDVLILPAGSHHFDRRGQD